MPTETTNLGLKKPQLSDNIYSSLSDLALNFQLLDDAALLYSTGKPNSGTHPRGKFYINESGSIGDSFGWYNVRAGIAAPSWSSLTSVSAGAYIVPTMDNLHVYICTQAGSTGFNQPTWPLTSGATVREVAGSVFWETGKHYNLNDVVLPTSDNGRFYLCVQAGNTATIQPNWPTTAGAILDDNTTRWRCYVIARWQEAGTAANFRPFGLIG
jgi:hypothetical protein